MDEVSTGSDNRVLSPRNARVREADDPVAIAPGTDLITRIPGFSPHSQTGKDTKPKNEFLLVGRPILRFWILDLRFLCGPPARVSAGSRNPNQKSKIENVTSKDPAGCASSYPAADRVRPIRWILWLRCNSCFPSSSSRQF
jgi:hypothetical protein